MIDQQLLLNVGFKPPPPVEYTKPDPRGREYGTFEASALNSPPPCLMMQVKKRDTNGHAIYTMYFPSAESFAAWAKEET